jgi:peptidoglycan/LPS O-acetylase OafA/YrhL
MNKISDASLRNLDVLRGLLALYVVFTHARWLLWQGHSAFLSQPHAAWEKALAYGAGGFKYGHLAVMVFFALSGFFIHLRLAQKLADGHRSPTLGTAEYLKRRAWRILPVYYFALALTLVLDTIGRAKYPMLYQAATPDAFTNQVFALKGYSLESVIPALLLLPRSLGLYFGSNGPLWSLGFEMIYYLAYPAWFALRKRFGQRAYLIGFAIAIGAAFCRMHAEAPMLDWATEVISLWAVWLTGAWLAETVTSRVDRKFVLGGAAAALVAWAGSHVHLPEPVKIPLLMALGGGVVLVFASLPTRMVSLRVVGWMETLGQQSYTLYVCHFPVIALISARAFQTGGERPSHGWLALYGVVAAVIVAKASFYLCERHFLHARIRLETKPVPTPIPVAQPTLAKLEVKDSPRGS